MKGKWPLVKLGEILTERKEKPDLEAVLNGQIPIVAKIGFDTGRIQLREENKTKTNMILIRPRDLVISGINAAKGGIALYDEGNTEPAAATIHYSSYSINKGKAEPLYLWYFMRSDVFRKILISNLPNGIKTEVKPQRFLPIEIPLPPLSEQKHIVAKIEGLMAKIDESRKFRDEIGNHLQNALLSTYSELIMDAEHLPMTQVAPVVRRPIELDIEKEYPELGIRSFGKGVFHKPPINGALVGTKKLYRIEEGDLLFHNVFAWEGAVAVAGPEDNGRVGSHRFISCVPQKKKVTSHFLHFHFLTRVGLNQLGEASPGGAGRNRTLGIDKLGRIQVPVPPFPRQVWFDALQAKVDELKKLQAETKKELEELVPSILDKAFKGES